MFAFIAHYPGFFLLGLTTLGVVVKGLRASIRYGSWKPLAFWMGAELAIWLLSFVIVVLYHVFFEN